VFEGGRGPAATWISKIRNARVVFARSSLLLSRVIGFSRVITYVLPPSFQPPVESRPRELQRRVMASRTGRREAKAGGAALFTESNEKEGPSSGPSSSR